MEETGSTVTSKEDEFGYRWLVLADPDFEDLVVALNTVSTQLQGGGYGDRLLAAVFAFEEKGKPIYLIYNFKRGTFYPFVPAKGEQARDNERELRLRAQLGNGSRSRRRSDAGSRSGTCRCSEASFGRERRPQRPPARRSCRGGRGQRADLPRPDVGHRRATGHCAVADARRASAR